MGAMWRAPDEHSVVVAWVDERVGWGLFAGKRFEAGDYVCRYGALATASDAIVNRDYTMTSGVPGVAYDAVKYRNVGGFINHDALPNVSVYAPMCWCCDQSYFSIVLTFFCRRSCVFECGCEQIVVLASETIERGQQLFHDYSRQFWQNDSEQSKDNVPSNIIQCNRQPLF
jgi:hypothetical protein